MKLDKSCTYTKWCIYYRRNGDTFTFYKTRFRRPKWWPKNISSPGYEETIELATAFYSIQQRYTVGHFWVGMYLHHIEWNKDVKIKFIDRLRILKDAFFIEKWEI